MLSATETRLCPNMRIVTLGDSQTWGLNATFPELTWSGRLGIITGQSVYNMGVGGYGPAQYYVLTEDAIQRFHPKLIIVALYFGNDLWDSYFVTYKFDHYKKFRNPSVVFDEKYYKKANDQTGSIPVAGLPANANDAFNFCKARAIELSQGFLDNGKVRTTFTSSKRLIALNPSMFPISEGIRLTEKYLSEIQKSQIRITQL